ncbi:hypothetical protein BASA50_010054 [Batrachochytrium salamandrivorans]|uniref:Uncharacterized protein n=1 Tax=Batrachochytrium salamandrivorans TaxID=1357716 RepID=A0ABQ8EZL4_9FUNG|nr:hypothetical protein BASA50_010054 [Batrachochytrium salamandrivorans]
MPRVRNRRTLVDDTTSNVGRKGLASDSDDYKAIPSHKSISRKPQKQQATFARCNPARNKTPIRANCESEYEFEDVDRTLVHDEADLSPAASKNSDNVQDMFSSLKERIKQKARRSSRDTASRNEIEKGVPLSLCLKSLEAHSSEILSQYENQSRKKIGQIREEHELNWGLLTLPTKHNLPSTSDLKTSLQNSFVVLEELGQTSDQLCNEIRGYCQMQQAEGRQHEMALRKVMMERERVIKQSRALYIEEVQAIMDARKIKKAIEVLFE